MGSHANGKRSHVTARAVYSDGKLTVLDLVTMRAALRQMGLGDGEELVVRVERQQDAKRHHQLKWFHGYIVKQCIDFTGETAKERADDFKARFLPPDVPGLTEMSYEQMRDFNTHCEVFAGEVIGVSIVGPDDARRWIDELEEKQG